MTRLLQLVSALVALALILLAAALLVASTPAGTAWLLGVGTGLTGGQVRAEGVTGTLLDGLEVQRLTVVLPTVSIEADHVAARVFWPDLLRRRLHLTRASVGSLRIRTVPDEDEEPAAPLLLPFVVEARPAEIGRLEVTLGDATPIVVESAQIDGELAGGVLLADRLVAQLYGLAVEASGRIGTGAPFDVAAVLRWNHAEAGVQGAGTVAGNLESLKFQQRLAVPGAVGVNGTLALLDNPRVEAVARFEALSRPVGDDVVLEARAGELGLSGWTDAWEARFGGELAITGQPPVKLSATARGNLEQAEVQVLAARGLGGTATGSAKLAFTDGLKGEFLLAGRGLDPGTLEPRVRGRINIDAAGTFDGEGNFTAVVDRASGTLRDRPLTASGTVRRRDGTYAAEKVRVAVGENRLALSGTWGQALSATFDLDAPVLGTLWPEFSGALRARGSIAGTTRSPRFDVTASGEALRFGEWQLASLTANGRLGSREALDIDVDARGITSGTTGLGDLTLRADGRLAEHRLELALADPDVAFTLAGEGGYARGVLRETFASGDVRLPGDLHWTLRDPLFVEATEDSVAVAAHCWTTGGGEPSATPPLLCVGDSEATAARQAGALTLRGFPMTTVAALGLLPERVGLTGTADLDASLVRAAGRFDVRLRWEQKDTTVSFRTEEGAELSTRFDDFLVSVEGNDADLTYQAVVSESFGTLLTANGRITDLAGAATIDGRIQGSVPDLARLAPLVESVADVGDIKGSVQLDVGLTGPLRRPDLSGGVTLADGALSVPAAGILVDRIQLSVEGRPDGRAELKGSARSAKGYVQLGGYVGWRELKPEAEVTVRGRNLEVIRLPEGTVQVSPDVRVRLVEGRFLVGGELLVPRAEIVLKRLGQAVVVPSPDAVVHGREDLATERGPALFALDGLAVKLGPKVTFQGFGLDARLTGSVVLDQKDPNAPDTVTANGSVQVAEGKFTALGEDLTIDRGNLVFAGGAATDPGIDARASRDVTWEGREVTVGVRLSGTLSKIQTTIFSEPAMGEMDALSYLTTGKPLSANSSGDRFSVSSAALTLGLQGALPVAKRVGDVLNVDEIGLAGAGGEGTEVVVGEQIGKDLYLRYSYGIFNKLGTIKATYRLSRRVSLEGSSGEEQSLDLLYSIDW